MGCLATKPSGGGGVQKPESLFTKSSSSRDRGTEIKLDPSESGLGNSNLFSPSAVDSLRGRREDGQGSTGDRSTAKGSDKATAGDGSTLTTDGPPMASNHDNKRNSVQQPQGQQQPPRTNNNPNVTKPRRVERPKDTPDHLSKSHLVIPKHTFAEEYEMGKKIGEGNYSEVFEALDRRTGLKVAVKVTSKDGLEAPDIRELKEEVSILRDLQHPNIIEVFGFYEDAEAYYMVTEFMEGGELFDEIVEREFYWERDAQEVVRMLADALNFMHKRGIVHRDLKPENILLTAKGKDGVVKLADFGFAARVDVKSNGQPLRTACGTPAYVSPEIVRGMPYGAETDMWSLGVITFVLLAGYPPFHDDDVQELFKLIRRGKFHMEPTYWNLVSDEAKSCVKAMLTNDGRIRPTAEQILKHPWLAQLAPIPEQLPEATPSADALPVAPSAPQFHAGVGGRGLGGDGRGPPGSHNIGSSIPELRKFQARRRWKNDIMMALIREGQMGVLEMQDAEELLQENVGHDNKKQAQGEGAFRLDHIDDFTKLGGLGQSSVLDRLQSEKRAAAARAPGVGKMGGAR